MPQRGLCIFLASAALLAAVMGLRVQVQQFEERFEPDPIPPPANETLPFIPIGLPSDDIRFGRGNATLPGPAGPAEVGPPPPPADPITPLPNFDEVGVGEDHLKILDLPAEVEPYPVNGTEMTGSAAAGVAAS